MQNSNKIEKLFWKNKKVLVTGHTGFKGSWLSLSLLNLGAEVTGLSLPPPTNPSLFELLSLSKKINSILGDIRDIQKISEVIKNCKPEIVFHLAAQPLVIDSYIDPIETYSTNVMGTANVLEACRLSKSVRSIINITTDKCYKNEGSLWGFRETDELGGNDPYSNSKACSELICQAYNKSFFEMNNIRLITARAGNIIGGGDWSKNRLFPDILKALQNNKSPEIRNPNHTRPWQHVIDPIIGYLLLGQKIQDNYSNLKGGINFGPEFSSEASVKDFVNLTLRIWGKEINWKQSTKISPKEASSLSLDITKAKTILKWSPKIDLETGIRMSVDWHKAWVDKKNMFEFSIKQINQYLSEK